MNPSQDINPPSEASGALREAPKCTWESVLFSIGGLIIGDIIEIIYTNSEVFDNNDMD